METQRIKELEFTDSGITTAYLAAGPESGPLLIFVHGWPGIAETWKPQLKAFAALGFHVVAPDTRGYGRSTVSCDTRDYSLEVLVRDLIALLDHLERQEAVWIGHDWGSGIVWALAAHHPEVCVGVINLCVPYRTLELGLEAQVALVNRDIYPADQYPSGQFDYQKYYEQHSERSTQVFEADPGNSIKCIFVPGSTAIYGLPGPTANVTRSGGWFGGASRAPNTELNKTVLDESIFTSLRESLTRNGFFGPTSYYLNHDLNKTYSKSSTNGGVLNIPTLFIEARYDRVLSTSISRLSEPMRRYCHNLTECSIEAGHWVALERPQEVNAAIARWLVVTLPTWWPGFWHSPFVSNSAKSTIREDGLE
jgi:soluble epoxide hydrolase/lipid-phosphate phosphatase